MEIFIFAVKTIIVLSAVILFFSGIAIIVLLVIAKVNHKSELEVESIHEKIAKVEKSLRSATSTKSELKEFKKREKARSKEESKANNDRQYKKKVFLLDFRGDVQAHQVESFRQEISALLQVATAKDEIVIRLESSGGDLSGYGLAASQLLRLKAKQIPTTVCIDKVAASGGYMIACVADKILCAPFAVVGSIGVAAEFPNFHRALKKLNVDFKEYTAGEQKRTVTALGEITPEKEHHFSEKLKDVHEGFKSHVARFRPQLDLVKVANGDHWFGFEAEELRLVDELSTSDDYLLSFEKGTLIYRLEISHKKVLAEKVSDMMGRIIRSAFDKAFVGARRFF